MKGGPHNKLLFAIVLILSLVTVNSVHAAGFNLTTAGSSATINGAVFEVIYDDGPIPLREMVRLSGASEVHGYNTDYRPPQFDENNSAAFTKAVLLSDVLQVDVDGTIYREFQLDINQETTGNSRYITLDDVELYESPSADLCGYPFDGSGGGHAGCFDPANRIATLKYGMDVGEDSFIVLDYGNNVGNGKRDLRLLVLSSSFDANPNCNYDEAGCAVYVTLYSEFGADSDPGNDDPLLRIPYSNNDGYEAWVLPINVDMDTCNVKTVSGVTEYFGVTHEACEILVLGPDFNAADGANVSASSGWEIWLEPGFTIEIGATFGADVCGQSLCLTSPSPMPLGCHSCVDLICASDGSCCGVAFDQACLDMVDTVCGLVCEQ